MNIIKSFLYKCGLQINKLPKPDPIIDTDEKFLNYYNTIAPYTMTSKLRCYSLYAAIKHIEAAKVAGDFVECGVWKGGNTMLMAKMLKANNDLSRNIYLYDTFEGMSEPTALDRKTGDSILAKDKWQKTDTETHNEWCYASLEEVQQNMRDTNYPNDKLQFVKGKVEETLVKIKPETIALLRLDTDWYESTKIELETLFPLLSPGGVLIIDDYGTWEGARKAVDEYFTPGEILLNRIDNTGVIGIKK